MAHRHAEYSRAAIRMLGSADAVSLRADETKFMAVTYALQVVGEAASHVSPEGRTALANVPWHRLVGMRHRLVHGYRTRSPDLIVGTVRDDLPPLIDAVERTLKDDTP